MPHFGCVICCDEGKEFYPASVKEQLDHVKEIHGITKFDDPSYHADSALELLSEIMGIPPK